MFQAGHGSGNCDRPRRARSSRPGSDGVREDDPQDIPGEGAQAAPVVGPAPAKQGSTMHCHWAGYRLLFPK